MDDREERLRGLTSKVFGNSLIIENILSHLSIPELLQAQRIHSQFKTTIEQSASLQRQLFFKPITTHDAGKETPYWNPPLARLFAPLFSLYRYVDDESFETFGEMTLYWDKIPDMRERILRPEASWRRMFPVQPPARLEGIIILDTGCCFPANHSPFRARLGRQHQPLQEPGIRMGMLFDLVAHISEFNPQSSFYVHWQMFPQFQQGHISHILPNYYDNTKEEVDETIAYEMQALRLSDNGEELSAEEEYGKENDGPKTALIMARGDQCWNWMFDGYDKKLKNGITIYHEHQSDCSGKGFYPSKLKVETTLTDAWDAEPKKMLEFLEEPETGSDMWTTHGMMVEDADKYQMASEP